VAHLMNVAGTLYQSRVDLRDELLEMLFKEFVNVVNEKRRFINFKQNLVHLVQSRVNLRDALLEELFKELGNVVNESESTAVESERRLQQLKFNSSWLDFCFIIYYSNFIFI
jgi:uncharacterized protein YdcH (DUF465 family)